ncbi:MAG: hypothetical protein KDB01_18550 [Planctomycetaceae bacterium]|nr:hypothetical protein [Planctomycetaceae bacterium]
MWWWFILFGLHALAALFIRVGWVIPFTMGGSYFGMFVLHPPITSVSIESRTYAWVTGIVVGTVVGFGVGFTADSFFPTQQAPKKTADAPECDEQKSG